MIGLGSVDIPDSGGREGEQDWVGKAPWQEIAAKTIPSIFQEAIQ